MDRGISNKNMRLTWLLIVHVEYGIFMNQVQGITKAQQNFELVIGDFVNGDNLLTRP